MPLRVRYARAAEFVRDFDSQLARGGMLVRADCPDLVQFSPIALLLEGSIGDMKARVSLDAQVMQVFAGVGVAVTFDARLLDCMREIVAKARSLGDAAGADATHEFLARAPADEAPDAAADDEAHDDEAADDEPAGPRHEATPLAVDRVRSASGPEKIQLALRGSRDERMLLMRENNPQIHGFVLRNPGLQIDEILAIAKLRTVAPDLLKQISEKREWMRADIALALVRNPKTPTPVAVRMLDHISSGDLRALAKDTKQKAAVQSAARKKVIAP